VVNFDQIDLCGALTLISRQTSFWIPIAFDRSLKWFN
jgi:hypothetical protein